MVLLYSHILDICMIELGVEISLEWACSLPLSLELAEARSRHTCTTFAPILNRTTRTADVRVVLSYCDFVLTMFAIMLSAHFVVYL